LELDQRTIDLIIKLVLGEPLPGTETEDGHRKKYTKTLSKNDLYQLFEELGYYDHEEYFRHKKESYAKEVISSRLTLAFLSELIHKVLTPLDGNDYSKAKDYLNQLLIKKGYECYAVPGQYGQEYHIKEFGYEHSVEVAQEMFEEHPLTRTYIYEHIEKCIKKIDENDYPGAITNSRTLLEELMSEIQKKLDPSPKNCCGDMLKQYKDVQSLLDLDPNQHDIEAIQFILRGLNSVIRGLSTLRNSSSDSHASKFRPMEYHAQLAVNSAKTVCNFLLASFEHQLKEGYITLVEKC